MQSEELKEADSADADCPDDMDVQESGQASQQQVKNRVLVHAIKASVSQLNDKHGH